MVQIQTNGSNLFSQIRRIVEQGSVHLFITLSSKRLFNKADLEQYLFNTFVVRLFFHF